jgi:hypothetical protein
MQEWKCVTMLSYFLQQGYRISTSTRIITFRALLSEDTQCAHELTVSNVPVTVTEPALILYIYTLYITAKGFFSLRHRVQTGCGAHPVPYSRGTGFPSRK